MSANTCLGGVKKMKLVVSNNKMRSTEHKLKYRKFLKNTGGKTQQKPTNLFYCEGGQILKQVAQQCCKSSILHDMQNLTGEGPGQLALADPVLSRGVRLDDLLRFLPTSIIL